MLPPTGQIGTEFAGRRRRFSRITARAAAAGGLLLAVVALVGSAPFAEAATTATTTTKRPTGSGTAARRPAPTAGVPLVWHVESLDGRVLDGKDSDRPINPASIVKIATTAWALEKLGPQHRFSTRIMARGTIDRARRVLVGDLHVVGSGDPDFHVENAFLLATQLNDLGIDTVRGRLLVTERFWIGWENGSDGRMPTPAARGDQMAWRLRRAMDPRRWDRRLQGLWQAFAQRRGLSTTRPARVAVTGEARLSAGPLDGTVLLEHLSKPLVETLRRFNCFSNNDIERLEATLGTPDDLEQYLLRRWQMPTGTLELATTSGLGLNRLTPRLIVLLLRDLQDLCRRLDLPVEAVLPVAGCDPGTLESFRLLDSGLNANAVAGKTGTLVSTDGGIAVLAGFARTAQGEVLFCVAAPNAGRRLSWSRRAEERWVVDLISRHGGPRQRACQLPLPPPDQDAQVSIIGAI